MLEYKSICDDQVFAQLTDLFSDTVPTEFILKTGQDTKWKRKYRCVISKYSLNNSDWIELHFERQNHLSVLKSTCI